MAATACSTFLNLHPNTPRPRVRPAPPRCGKLDGGVAMWVINGVAAAFFASLEKCSCIRIATYEDVCEEAIDLPLIYNDGNMRHGQGGRRRFSGKAKKGGSSTFVEHY